MKNLEKNLRRALKKTGNIETEANELLRGNKIGVPTSVRIQNHVENHVQSRVQNCNRKIKIMANKNMSFLKITDPEKRDIIVNEFLKTRQNIQQNFLSERVGDLSTQ